MISLNFRPGPCCQGKSAASFLRLYLRLSQLCLGIGRRSADGPLVSLLYFKLEYFKHAFNKNTRARTFVGMMIRDTGWEHNIHSPQHIDTRQIRGDILKKHLGPPSVTQRLKYYFIHKISILK
ncbi:hypothetical protein [uncultured Ruegeria sp.]|uniref:hypothetical protein n=1 Tax=uncultured Ruegeria sp. TaxID=259304 RepID=UPI0026343410|nr:hypothetical protein [uncultured Ruegeria sp.]